METAAKPTSFANLWDRLLREAEVSGNDRLKAVLMNHERRKEHICRKLGVVTDADVNRIASGMKKKESMGQKA